MLIAVSVSAAETMVSEVIEKLKDVGLTVGAQKTHWTSFSEDDGQKHHGGRIGCGVGGSSGVCGIDGVSGWKCKTFDRTQNSSSQQMPCKMETCVEFPMAPQIAAVEHRKNYDVAGFPLELECLDDGQSTERQNCELERENGGECCWSEKTARNGAGTVVETLAQDWSSLDREMQYECADGHQRSYAQLGWTCGKDGLQRNLCEGSEMSRPSMVEMETDKLERGGERQMVWSTPTTVQNLQVGGHGVGRGLQVCLKRRWFVGNGPKTTRVGCILLKTVEVGCNFRNVERALKRWSRVPRGPKRVRHDWDESSGCLADREKNCEGEIWRALATPLGIKPTGTLPSSCSAGYGWLGSYGSWYGRRRGRWNGKSEIRSDVDWFCQTCGTKVLSWNVAGVVFASLISSVEDLEPGMTDSFHVGELILGPQLTDDLNDFMSASAAHMTCDKTRG